MQNDIETALRTLKAMDERELQNVLTHVKRRRRILNFYKLPLHAKIGIVHGIVSLATFAGLPPMPEIPLIAYPIVWFASLSTTILIVTFIPTARRGYEAHWVKG